MILLDTNLLARITNSADPRCAVARSAIDKLRADRERIVIVPQNLFEFWAVATRQPGLPPTGHNGLGMTIDQTDQWLKFFQRRFTLLPDRGDLPERWRILVTSLGIKGFRSHDARLVAAMESYGITQLLTFNGNDFKPFVITVVDPLTMIPNC